MTFIYTPTARMMFPDRVEYKPPSWKGNIPTTPTMDNQVISEFFRAFETLLVGNLDTMPQARRLPYAERLKEECERWERMTKDFNIAAIHPCYEAKFRSNHRSLETVTAIIFTKTGCKGSYHIEMGWLLYEPSLVPMVLMGKMFHCDMKKFRSDFIDIMYSTYESILFKDAL